MKYVNDSFVFIGKKTYSKMPDNEIRFIDTSVQLDKDLNILIIEYSFLPCKMLPNKKIRF